jgi:hypothetical protein
MDSALELTQFARWWLREHKPHRPPPDARVLETDHTLSMIVLREDNIQVELYLAKPNFQTPKHTHLFDSITIFNGGYMEGRRGKELSEEPNWFSLDNSNIDEIQPPLPTGWWHQLRSLDTGFSFYNVQHWKEHDPTSATIGYVGKSMGPVHDKLLSRID